MGGGEERWRKGGREMDRAASECVMVGRVGGPGEADEPSWR